MTLCPVHPLLVYHQSINFTTILKHSLRNNWKRSSTAWTYCSIAFIWIFIPWDFIQSDSIKINYNMINMIQKLRKINKAIWPWFFIRAVHCTRYKRDKSKEGIVCDVSALLEHLTVKEDLLILNKKAARYVPKDTEMTKRERVFTNLHQPTPLVEPKLPFFKLVEKS